MHGEISADIFAGDQRALWRSSEPSIWTPKDGQSGLDSTVSILASLLDQPRWLEACYLYDEIGSDLFEQICELPEYYLTRTENSILEKEASRIIAAAPVDCIVELGAGSAKKTMHLLNEQIRQRGGGVFAPIDVSLAGLTASRDESRQRFPQLSFHGLHSRYEEGVSSIDKTLPTLFIFLGSTVGNLTRSEFVRFFHHLSASMGPRDFFLLGADRIKKTEILEKAYADSRGLTADFILNVFHHINRLLRSNFDHGRMRYHSWYNPDWQQVEMYAIATATQEIRFPSYDTRFTWAKEDRILVEISRKFDPLRLQQQIRVFGLSPVAHYADPKDWFSLLLFKKSN